MVDLAKVIPVKRRRISIAPDYSAFRKGNIIRCKLSNFMSYNLTEFHCDPRMNLIIGPNGSGKSTFVCAVCIGLGGKLSNLGKESMSVDQFIKSGEDNGYIELELKASDDDVKVGTDSIVIKTTLIKGKKKPSWKIDGQTVGEQQVKKILESYNIQLDSLCQFLPQDRVSKFAELKPEELLKEIERSYQDGQLLAQHLEIIRLNNEIESDTKAIEEQRRQLEEYQARKEDLQRKAEKHLEYLKLQEDIKKIQLVQPWFKLNDLKQQRNEAKENEQLALAEINKFLEKFGPFQEIWEQSKDNIHKNSDDLKRVERLIEKHLNEMKEYSTELESLEKKIEIVLNEIDDYSNKRKDLESKIESVNGKIEQLNEALDPLPNVSTEEIKDLKIKKNDLSSKISELNIKGSDIKLKLQPIKKQIESHRESINKKQQSLTSKDRLPNIENKDLVRLIRFLRSQELDFKYFEPAVLILNVRSEVANAVDALMRFSDKFAIIVKSDEDHHKLGDLMDKNGLRASIRTLGKNFNPIPSAPLETLKHFGFDGFLSEYISGPPEVIQMVCENSFLHDIPISINGLSDVQIREFMQWNSSQQRYVGKFVSGSTTYRCSRSRFGKKSMSTTATTLNKPKFQIFQDGISDDIKQRYENEIQSLQNKIMSGEEEIRKINEEAQELGTNLKDYKYELADIDERLHKLKNHEKKRLRFETMLKDENDRLETYKKRLKSLTKSHNSSSIKDSIYTRIESYQSRKSDLAQKSLKTAISINQLEIEAVKWRALNFEEDNKQIKLKNINNYIETKKRDMEETSEHLRQIYQKTNQKYKEQKAQYTEELKIFSIEQKQEIKLLVEHYREIVGDSGESIEREVEKMRSSLSLLQSAGNAESLELLKQSEQKCQELMESIPVVESICDRKKLELSDVFDVWRPQLDQIVKIVDRDFGANMRSVASGGGVELDASEKDYSKWKLIIKVSFRDNEDMTQFNGAQHSGGEKSTTTAVFLNSLQGLTNAPFRVVDEINQGMDSKNERNAHKLIVERATDANVNASQYFLITPKLLTNLYYDKRMTVHCIFSGKWTPMYEDNPKFLEMGTFKNYLPTTATV